MTFIDLYFALSSIAEQIQHSLDSDECRIFTPAGKMAQSSAANYHKRVAAGIDMANRMSQAARVLSEVLQNSKLLKPNLLKYDEDSACPSPGDNDTWSRMKSMLIQAMFWNIREKRYCVEHFAKAKTEGEYFLRGPIHRHETDNWLTPDAAVLRPTSIGFDADEFFAFLDTNRIPYTHQDR